MNKIIEVGKMNNHQRGGVYRTDGIIITITASFSSDTPWIIEDGRQKDKSKTEKHNKADWELL